MAPILVAGLSWSRTFPKNSPSLIQRTLATGNLAAGDESAWERGLFEDVSADFVRGIMRGG
jgi:hypothetical protein